MEDNMTNEYASQTNSSSHLGAKGSRGNRPLRGGLNLKKPYAECSAEEIQEMMREKVAKVVAVAAGFVEGFASQMKESEVTENTEMAIQKIGETASTIVRTTREQVMETKSAFIGEGGSGGSGGSYSSSNSSSSSSDYGSDSGLSTGDANSSGSEFGSSFKGGA